MIFLPPIPHRLSTKAEIAIGLAFMTISFLLLLQHALRVGEMRDIGLPSAMKVPTIEQRLSILKEQSDAVELQANLTGGQNDEALHAYVLPNDGKMNRTLSVLDTLLTVLQKQGHVRNISAMHVGNADGATAGSAAIQTPITFQIDADEQGMQTLVSFVDASGFITVNDALSETDRSTLLQLTEQENPAAVTSLESFLATDLLSYLQDPKPFNDQLLKSFSSDAFDQSFGTIIAGSNLGTLQHMINSDLRQALASQKLWPTQFMTMLHADVHDDGNGWLHVLMNIGVMGRVK